MKDGRAEHSGLTERPILNELNVISAEGPGDERDSLEVRSSTSIFVYYTSIFVYYYDTNGACLRTSLLP
jgi:hypothetical protein